MARTLLLLPCSQPPPVTILPVPNDAPSPGSMARPLLTPSPVRGRGALLVMANAKKSLGCTKQGTRRCVCWGGGGGGGGSTCHFPCYTRLYSGDIVHQWPVRCSL